MEQVFEEDFSSCIHYDLASLMVHKRLYPLHIVSNIDPCNFLLNFSTMSDVDFKKLLLSSSLNNWQRDLLNEYFYSNEDVVSFIRQLFHLTNMLNYVKLQYQQWSHYYNLGLDTGIWSGRVCPAMAFNNSMPMTYGQRKKLIEQRQNHFKEQIQKFTTELQQQKQLSNSNINIDLLTIIANDFIEKGQYQLRLELERRQHILVFDAKDHELVDLFYKLKPRNAEVCEMLI